MKKIFILFAIFSLQIAPTFADENASNSATDTITVSGTIMLPDGEGPAIGATVLIDGTATGTIADFDGKFTLSKVPENASVKISYTGCKAQKKSAETNMGTITLDCDKQLNEVVVKNTLSGKPCATAILQGLNAESGTWKSDNNVLYCDIQCAKNWTKQSGTYEIDNQDGKSKQRYKCECVGDNIIVNGACTPINNCSTDENATTSAYEKQDDNTYICKINECQKGWKPNGDGNTCIEIKERTEDQKKQHPDALSTGIKKDAELSEQDSLAKIDKLKDNAQKMRDKEQSTENKLLGAAGIGATGIGAMQMLSASAEQSADQDAEAAMRAYLATFHCNYGMGKNIAGGEKQVELPGGNELIGLYAEYVNLANDLKIRKNALGMRAGIESEPILDSATSGLYDDIAIGKTSGAYTSLARAIMDPTGADAIAWAKQKADTADKLKTGAITAGIGALGSLAGNLAINSGDAKKNKVNDIIAEFDKKKKIFQDLESDIKKIPPQVEKCPAGTTGTKHPDCTCTGNAEYNTDNKSCDPCADGQTIVEGKCTCTGDTPLWDEQNEKCIKQPQQCTAKCTPYDGSHLLVLPNCSCTCIHGFTISDDEQSCTCDEQTHEFKNDECVKKSAPQPVAEKIKIILPADLLFELGKDEISTAAKPALNKFINELTENGIKNCKLTINGYTDRTGNENFNKNLSEKRAEAVKAYLITNGPNTFNEDKITTSGKGEDSCNCGVAQVPPDKKSEKDYIQCADQKPEYTNSTLRYAPCRRVTIELDNLSCLSTTSGDLGSTIQTDTSNITQ